MAGKTEVGETGSENNNLEEQKKKDEAIQKIKFLSMQICRKGPCKYPQSGAASPEMQGSRQAPPLPMLMELSGGAPRGLLAVQRAPASAPRH